ncbi:MAG: ABC-F family ATP-binding cassette domain-containing protein [Syntrophomonadaceae bacterium]|nr:ABC-F family ATP-binding cassette domain-containing protein [Syntrophomonadaceae bacterium]
MIVLQVNNLKKTFGEHTLFSEVQFTLNQGDKVGLVGANGSGKSTLLKCIAGQLVPDLGEVTLSTGIRAGYLEQLPDLNEDISVWDAVMQSFAPIILMREQMQQLQQQIALGGKDVDGLLQRYADVIEAYERADGYACEAKARKILIGLGFSLDMMSRRISSFSGGELTRLNLARLLAFEPEVLLLDEPTNHLDIGSVEWLESFLCAYRGTILVVAHDRRFLDQVTTRILDLKQGQVKSYPGNYSKMLELRAVEDVSQRRSYEKQQQEIACQEEYIRRFRAGIKAKQARGRQLQLDRLERLENINDDKTIGSWTFQLKETSGDEVLVIDNLSKSFDQNQLFRHLNLLVRQGERLALLGTNGSGKSTLLNIIMGNLSADFGSVKIGSRVTIGYFSQHHESLNPDNSVLDEIIYSTDITVGEARNVLGRMLFHGDDVYKKVAHLSGGEKSRLALLKLYLSRPNFLILDEPTNHLDIDSRETVESMLINYPGTILFVSHDRYFIDRIAMNIAVIGEEGLKTYLGNYSDNQVNLVWQKPVEAQNKNTDSRSNAQQFRLQKKEEQRIQRRMEKELEQLEKDIQILEQRQDQLHEQLSDETVFADMNIVPILSTELQEIETRLQVLYQDWADQAEHLHDLVSQSNDLTNHNA